MGVRERIREAADRPTESFMVEAPGWGFEVAVRRASVQHLELMERASADHRAEKIGYARFMAVVVACCLVEDGALVYDPRNDDDLAEIASKSPEAMQLIFSRALAVCRLAPEEREGKESASGSAPGGGSDSA